ncbi:hypothetical protein DW352_16970 [Pseudolabrys taiwanensis]|uniref:Uncharacterized protein n=1 Tax=Pseudolabrys taiwanensis TaxID=331696 RepID=A0A345ZYR8_9HYPH|nr:hypothetical protein [Pseudolabrys taiwanensis]AXK82065.1 hypothetical protein DW352_16970 [Pseudolabrys taiwanensis]
MSRFDTGRLMRINAIGATFGHSDDKSSKQAPAPADAPKAASRALVLTEPAPTAQDRPMAYRDAPFLAQLIATKAQVPQTRGRRRAEPAEALAAYRAVAKLVA